MCTGVHGARLPEVGVIGGDELLNLGAGNHPGPLSEQRMFSKSLSLLVSPQTHLLKTEDLFISYVQVCACSLCAPPVCWCHRRPEGGSRSPGSIVKGRHEPPHMGVGGSNLGYLKKVVSVIDH